MRNSLLALTACLLAAPAFAADSVDVDINTITAEGVGDKIGTIKLEYSSAGLKLTYSLEGLKGPSHGFHVHEKGDCGPSAKDGKMTAGNAAGPHFDPDHTKTHAGPEGAGHKGDLPLIKTDGKAKADGSVVAPRLKLADISGRSLMIHEGSDTYSDTPELGGGKGRIACGVIPK